MRIHRYIYTLLAIIALASCSSDDELSKVDVIGNDNPMRFGVANALEESTVTRASGEPNYLKAGFKVSTYKSYGIEAKQQVVMDGYEVKYTSEDTKKWNYVGVREGQIERYWDLSSYPYDFRACTPYLNGATLNNTGITLDLTAAGAPTFKAQTFLEGAYNQTEAESEACLISHVQRLAASAAGEYCDYDMLRPIDATTYTEINDNSKTSGVRDVHMPFHHLMSKVGFRFYIDDPTVPTYDIYMSKVEISVEKDGFITESKSYTASGDNLLLGTFGNLTTVNSQNLITKDTKYSKNLKECLNHGTAFDFNCPGDMVQIPQKDLKIHVKLTLDFNNGSSQEFDTYLNVDDTATTAGQKFTWEPNKHYIYYLHLKNLVEYPIITCTAELVPWDVVQTSDIETGL